ncbi:ATP-binding protein [Alkalimonas sp. NCh-2]|uniref:sensor histidine kinase n=1 Tax=Alkalimonas sp. NCh-2 TaxID=3144846 RepID=UPI0031F673FB
MDNQLRQIIEGVANTRGEAFFQAMTLQLSQVIKADFVFIARLDHAAYSSQTLALVVDGQLVDNMEYSLEHTPCANAADDSYCIYSSGIQQLFPQDQLLVDLGVEAYVGTPLHDLQGKVMGIVVAMYRQPVSEPEQVTTLFTIFSGRIEAEMERLDFERQLQQLNQQLEQKIKLRTADLEQALADIQTMQQQLVESEKLAALGQLVSGIAHEVNTPLGVAVTAQGIVEQKFQSFALAVRSNQLSKKAVQQYCLAMEQTLPLLTSNLQRAADLIQNFKRTSADQHSSEQHQIGIAHYYRQILSTLTGITDQAGVEILLEADPAWQVTTVPGSHVQVLSNLVFNSLQHGFAGQPGPHKITIKVRQQDDGYWVQYRDNGCGISDEVRLHLFEPFYTTARAQGASGLGLSILYNLVTGQLGGKVQLPATKRGFALDYSFCDLQP